MGSNVKQSWQLAVPLTLLLLLSTCVHFASGARNFVIVWEDDDTKLGNDFGSNGEEFTLSDSSEEKMGRLGLTDSQEPTIEWDEFGDTEDKTDDDLDPGSWSQVLEKEDTGNRNSEVFLFFSFNKTSFFLENL